MPATEDEVMAVEDLLEDDKSKGTPDIGKTLKSSTNYGCGPCDSEKGSEGSLLKKFIFFFISVP